MDGEERDDEEGRGKSEIDEEVEEVEVTLSEKQKISDRGRNLQICSFCSI